jgi:hypothetical protein
LALEKAHEVQQLQAQVQKPQAELVGLSKFAETFSAQAGTPYKVYTGQEGKEAEEKARKRGKLIDLSKS